MQANQNKLTKSLINECLVLEFPILFVNFLVTNKKIRFFEKK